MPGASYVRRPDASVGGQYVPRRWLCLSLLLSLVCFGGIARSQTSGSSDSSALINARRLLRDAQQWAAFGNLDAARALAERAADMPVDWPAGEMTPRAFLIQYNVYDQQPSSPGKVHNPLELGNATIPSQQPSSAQATQTASYQSSELEVRTTPDDPLTRPQDVNDPGPAERTALISRSMPERLSPGGLPTRLPAPAPQETTSGPSPQPTAPDAFANSEAMVGSTEHAAIPQHIMIRQQPQNGVGGSHSMPIVLSTAAPLHSPAHERNSVALLAIVGCCAAGFLLSPALVIASTIFLGRMFGNCSPLIRIEFRRTEVSETVPQAESERRVKRSAVSAAEQVPPPSAAPDTHMTHSETRPSSDLFEEICTANLAITPRNSATTKRAA